MNFQFILGQPWWFVLFCLMAGALAAGILYYRNQQMDLTLWQKRMLAFFRFGTIVLLCFFLLSPLLRLHLNRNQDPIIVLFQDNSQSLVMGANSLLMKGAYLEDLALLRSGLQQNFQLHTYSFGERVLQTDSFDFSDRITDISQVFATLESHYSNRNLGAIILASDGIYNRGQNPRFLTVPGFTPIYTLALGDTVARRDLVINRLNHNRITYHNNLFPLEIVVEARQASGLNSRVKIEHEGRVVWEQRISFNSDQYFQTLAVQLEATDVGIKRYSVTIDPIEGEISTANNRQDFFIEVIDSRQKVLLLAHAPHPDLGALRMALEDNHNYEAKVSLLRDFSGSLEEYNVIVWHQLPSQTQAAAQLIGQATRLNLPQLFILGAQSNLQAFNRLQTGLQIAQRTQGFNDARADINPQFTLFQPTDEINRVLPQLPPLQTHFASYTLSPAAQVFAYQRIGNITTTFPLVVFSETAERKTGIITGEGLWRWRLGNFAREENHQAFNDWVSRIIQYLSVVEDKSFFRVFTRAFIYENEPALFTAELYNRSYELVNEPEVNLRITHPEGVNFDYVFRQAGNAYSLNAGAFPAGEYRYTASVNFGGEDFTASGLFTVSPLNIEAVNTVADHNLLFQLAENSGGRMFYPDQMNELVKEITERDDIRPIIYTQYEFEDLINLRWIFFLLLLMLSVEWFVRKYSGGY